MNVRGETINSTNRAKITQAEITSDDIAEAMLIAKYGCLMNY
jgi:hypothetical protein